MSAPTISVVINTLNEARSIGLLLQAVGPWADEVVVVDMHSDDGTAQIARDMGARVSEHERIGFVEPAREFAVAQSSGDWILLLDADEIPHPSLARRLRELAATNAPYDVVLIPRLEIMLGRPIIHGGWWPLKKARFFRRGAVELTPTIHHGLQPRADARIHRLPARADAAIWHFSHFDLHEYVAAANRYTSIESRQMAEGGWRPQRPHQLLWPMVVDIAGRYVWRRGYRDGVPGLALAVVRAMNRFLRAAKAWEQSDLQRRADRIATLKTRMVSMYEAMNGDTGPAQPATSGPRTSRPAMKRAAPKPAGSRRARATVSSSPHETE
ncbi:glycosyltransferase family 2 protein [soil metagenome]